MARPVGTPQSPEAREKIRLARLGNSTITEEGREVLRQLGRQKLLGNKYGVGRVKSAEEIEKIRQANLGRVGHHRGKKHSDITKLKISLARRGKTAKEKNPNWKGGLTSINRIIRQSFEYKQWRKAVFIRDNYTCQVCSRHGGYLEADHIKRYADFPELRFELSNGQTLCRPCHLFKMAIEMQGG